MWRYFLLSSLVLAKKPRFGDWDIVFGVLLPCYWWPNYCCRRQPPILDTLHSLAPVFRPSYVLSKSWFLGGCLCKIFGGSNVCKFWGGGEQFETLGFQLRVCWIFIDKYVLNNSGKDGFISFWWYTWRHLYLDLLFSVRYRSIEIIWLHEFISSLLKS